MDGSQSDGGSDGGASSDLYADSPSPQPPHQHHATKTPPTFSSQPQTPSTFYVDNWRQPTPGKRKRDDEPLIHEKKAKFDDIPRGEGGAGALDLPPEVWQHVLLRLPPRDLGRMLRVNHMFRGLFSIPQVVQSRHSTQGALRLLHGEDVWRSARQIYHPSMPEALPGCTEIDMWRLVRGQRCSFCGRKYETPPSSPQQDVDMDNSLQSIFWSFAVRCCEECVSERTQDEASLLLSDASVFMSSQPFAFLADGARVVPTIDVRDSKIAISFSQIKKVYLKSLVERVRRDFATARAEGPDTARDLLDKMESQKAARMRAVEQWEVWDREGGLAEACSRDDYAEQNVVVRDPTRSREHTAQQASAPSTQSQPVPGSWTGSRPGSVISVPGLPAPSHSTNASHRRNVQHVNEARAARRAEIEKRCQELRPPLSPSVLQHMEAFHAALQISSELTESAWSVLRPRLLSQREAAEELAKNESPTDDNHSVPKDATESRRPQEGSLKEIKEAIDREWEESQAPIRRFIAKCADDFIRINWADGDSVTKENSPQFAADVLIHVRKRFFSDRAKDGSEVPQGKLLLDAMKWIYDAKVKPIAEEYRKDLFRCNVCDANSRYYGFEGVIQHYAAKHTNSFSAGHVVVDWKSAEWPENPPFAPDPTSRKPQPGYAVPAYPAGQPFAGPSYQQVHHTLPQRAISLQYPGSYGYPPGGQGSPPPYGSNPYPETYPSHATGPFMPPGGYPSPYNTQHPFPPPVAGTPATAHGWPVPLPGASYTTSPPGYGYHPPTVPPFPVAATSPYVTLPTSGYPPQSSSAPPGRNLYQSQRDELARIAHETLKATAGVKDIPPSVRVYTVIQQVVSHFRLHFSNEPNLDLFTDCLINHPLMAQLKDMNGLACKQCVLNNEDPQESHSRPFPSQLGERRLHLFQSLIIHFKEWHVERQLRQNGPNDETESISSRLDWKDDMIELPEDSHIVSLAYKQGMDDRKRQLLRAAFPSLFPTTETMRENEYDPRHPTVIESSSLVSPQHSDSGYRRVGVISDRKQTRTLAENSFARKDTNRWQQAAPGNERRGEPFLIREARKSPAPEHGGFVKLEDGEYKLMRLERPATNPHSRTGSRAVQYSPPASSPDSSAAADRFLADLQSEQGPDPGYGRRLERDTRRLRIADQRAYENVDQPSNLYYTGRAPAANEGHFVVIEPEQEEYDDRRYVQEHPGHREVPRYDERYVFWPPQAGRPPPGPHLTYADEIESQPVRYIYLNRETGGYPNEVDERRNTPGDHAHSVARGASVGDDRMDSFSYNDDQVLGATQSSSRTSSRPHY